MKNEIKKIVSTTIAVVLGTAIIMVIPQLIHNGFQFVAVDWQIVVASTLMIDEFVFLGYSYVCMKKQYL